MVRAMRTPSSSSSAGGGERGWHGLDFGRTNVDGLDSDALLDVGGLGVVVDLVLEHAGLAERVDERGAARARGAWVGWREQRADIRDGAGD